jgi:hypothetical protein
LINLKLDLKHELNEFEGSFEWDELKDDKFSGFKNLYILKCDKMFFTKYYSFVMNLVDLFLTYENLKDIIIIFKSNNYIKKPVKYNQLI